MNIGKLRERAKEKKKKNLGRQNIRCIKVLRQKQRRRGLQVLVS